jgi:hypothetical protein
MGEFFALILQRLNISNLLLYAFEDKPLDVTSHLKVVAFCFAAKIMGFKILQLAQSEI